MYKIPTANKTSIKISHSSDNKTEIVCGWTNSLEHSFLLFPNWLNVCWQSETKGNIWVVDIFSGKQIVPFFYDEIITNKYNKYVWLKKYEKTGEYTKTLTHFDIVTATWSIINIVKSKGIDWVVDNCGFSWDIAYYSKETYDKEWQPLETSLVFHNIITWEEHIRIVPYWRIVWDSFWGTSEDWSLFSITKKNSYIDVKRISDKFEIDDNYIDIPPGFRFDHSYKIKEWMISLTRVEDDEKVAKDKYVWDTSKYVKWSSAISNLIWPFKNIGRFSEEKAIAVTKDDDVVIINKIWEILTTFWKEGDIMDNYRLFDEIEYKNGYILVNWILYNSSWYEILKLQTTNETKLWNWNTNQLFRNSILNSIEDWIIEVTHKLDRQSKVKELFNIKWQSLTDKIFPFTTQQLWDVLIKKVNGHIVQTLISNLRNLQKIDRKRKFHIYKDSSYLSEITDLWLWFFSLTTSSEIQRYYLPDYKNLSNKKNILPTIDILKNKAQLVTDLWDNVEIGGKKFKKKFLKLI
jgi:hypothetical protein